jgi:hypothetical protein
MIEKAIGGKRRIITGVWYLSSPNQFMNSHAYPTRSIRIIYETILSKNCITLKHFDIN